MYPGPLLPLHPLWPALRAVEERARELSSGEEEGAVAPAELPALPALARTVPSLDLLPPPASPSLPPALALPEAPGDELPEDLRVSLEWRRGLAARRYRHEVSRARADETMRLAALDASLWREYQVAVNNLKIQEAMGGAAAAEARESRQRIMEVLEAKIAQARADSEERVAQRLRRLAEGLEDELARIAEEAQAQSQRRRLPMLDTGRRDRLALEERLKLPWEPPSAETVEPPSRDLFPEMAARYRQALDRQQAAVREVRQAQARRLRQAASVLRRLIRQDTETAARAQALAHGLLVYIPPIEPLRGTNVTGLCAEWLRQQWPQI